MKKLLRSLVAGACVLLATIAARADLDVGKPAPEINGKDIAGKNFTLSEQRGKYVVLEWYNPECPYVKKFYNAGALQKQQKKLADDGVVWISIYSTSEKIPHRFTPDDLRKKAEEWKTAPATTLYDGAGTVAKAYAAKTTPHIFIINPEGILIYRGAVDSIASHDAGDIAKAENYIDKVFAEAKAGKPVSKPLTKSYGCGVKI